MTKKTIYFVTAIFMLFCLDKYSFAIEDIEELKIKLSKLRQEINQIEYSYKKDLSEANKTCDDKIAVLKKEFHEKRTQYLNERDAKKEELFRNYNKSVRPMQVEERRLVNTIEPLEPQNFAKHR